MRMRTAVAGLALVCAHPAQADFSLVYEPGDGACAIEPAAFYVRGSLLRVDNADGSALYDGVEQVVTWLDHGARRQFQLELDDDAIDLQSDIGTATAHRLDKEAARAQAMMDANRGQLQEACRQLERQGMPCPQPGGIPPGGGAAGVDLRAVLAQQQAAMARMDPELLARAGIDAEAMQEGQAEVLARFDEQQQRAAAEVVDTGRSERIDGIACDVREWRLGDEVIEQRCDADWPALGLEAREQQVLERAVRRMQRWGASFDPLVERFGAPRDDDAGARVTLRKTCYRSGQVVGSVTARIAREALSPDRFVVPPDYAPGM